MVGATGIGLFVLVASCTESPGEVGGHRAEGEPPVGSSQSDEARGSMQANAREVTRRAVDSMTSRADVERAMRNGISTLDIELATRALCAIVNSDVAGVELADLQRGVEHQKRAAAVLRELARRSASAGRLIVDQAREGNYELLACVPRGVLDAEFAEVLRIAFDEGQVSRAVLDAAIEHADASGTQQVILAAIRSASPVGRSEMPQLVDAMLNRDEPRVERLAREILEHAGTDVETRLIAARHLGRYCLSDGVRETRLVLSCCGGWLSIEQVRLDERKRHSYVKCGDLAIVQLERQTGYRLPREIRDELDPSVRIGLARRWFEQAISGSGDLPGNPSPTEDDSDR